MLDKFIQQKEESMTDNVDPKHLETMRTIILKAKKSEDNRKKMVRIKEYENMEKIEKSEKKLQQISIW